MGQDREPANHEADNVRFLISDEEVIAHVAGFAVLRAVYEAEGYYDEAADGDPAEEDLYRIEVLDRGSAALAAEAMEVEAIGALADLGLTDRAVRRLFPATRWAAATERPGLVERYLLALAAALMRAAGPVDRRRVLEVSVGWSAAVIEDGFQALPAERRRQEPPAE